ncbi:Glycerol uptake facilitator protein [Serratia rubidaea]|nr:Glycerol uptake facilitator protein [Serratia rubidaea]
MTEHTHFDFAISRLCSLTINLHHVLNLKEDEIKKTCTLRPASYSPSLKPITLQDNNIMSQNTSPTLKGQCIAEFLGTGLLIFFGAGCVAALKLAGASFGQWEISVIWGFGVAMAIYLTAGISGAHLNPAVTIALWLFANFNGRRVVPFIIAQVAGAFCAAALVYGLYYNLFFDFEAAHNMVRGSAESLDLAGIFSTYPNPHISVAQAFLVETVITAILMCLILALTDDGNGVPRGPLAPLLIGILIAVIGASMGPLTGFALNPARDFGPKVFAYLAGWGNVAFTGARDIPYFLVPIFGPILGAILGAFGYRTLIGRHLPCDDCVEEEQGQPAAKTPQRKA